jgi:hypothetical protein
MKTTFLKACTFLLLFCFTSCSASIPVKIAPEYKGVDPRAQNIVSEYLELSRLNHIIFHNPVTVGFKNIQHGDVVGVCHYGGYFREIDVDINYWNNSTTLSHLALLYHELTHCYCTRDHDYGKEKKYPETEAARIVQAIQWKVNGGERPGHWDDGCPVSLMYPIVVDDDCMQAHYAEYTQEMFDRCEAW